MALLFSFKDVDVYPQQLGYFRPGQWLDDTCINLCFRLTEDEMRPDQVLLMDPAVVSFIRMQIDEEEEFEDLVRGQSLEKYSWIFFPISDSSSFSSTGTHWSLLLCHYPTLSFFYIDSAGTYNYSSSKEFAEKFSGLMKQRAAEIVTVPAPKQGNGYDCGVYTVLFAVKIARLLSEDDSLSGDTWATAFAESIASTTDIEAQEFRKKMIQEITTRCRR